MNQHLPGERTRRLLAAMSAKTSALEPQAMGGQQAMSFQSFVAGAVGSLRRPGPEGSRIPDTPRQLLLLYLWAGHTTSRDRDRLLGQLLVEISRHWPDEWRPVEPGTLRKLLGMVLDEKMSPKVCRGCSGTGKTILAGDWVIHGPCRGLGYYPWGARRLAELYGTSRRIWRKKYALRHEYVMRIVSDLENDALTRLNRQI